MLDQNEKPWHKNASNLLVVNSILAAIAAIIVQTFATEQPHPSPVWLVCGIAAMLIFIISAEKITEALSGNDVNLYAKWHLPYDIAVLLLLIDVVGLAHRAVGSWNYWSLGIAALCGVGWLCGWGCDTLFVMFRDKYEYPKWIAQLEGKPTSEPIDDYCDKLHRWLRKPWNKYTQSDAVGRPHEGVYTRLQPSRIHGVGVFAICKIKKGTALFTNSSDEIVWVDEEMVVNLPPNIRRLYDDFAIIRDHQYGCPLNFNRLTASWYLNDSEHPNVIVDEDYEMWAARDIAEGEELTIDSSKFSAQPYKHNPS